MLDEDEDFEFFGVRFPYFDEISNLFLIVVSILHGTVDKVVGLSLLHRLITVSLVPNFPKNQLYDVFYSQLVTCTFVGRLMYVNYDLSISKFVLDSFLSLRRKLIDLFQTIVDFLLPDCSRSHIFS